MQNKQAIIGIIAAAIILVGAGGAFLYSKNNPKPTDSNTTKALDQESMSTKNNILGLLKSGKTQKCTFAYDDPESGSTEGIVYLTGNQMRSDISMTTDGKSSAINMIRNGDDTYIWGSSIPNNMGIKMTISQDELISDTSSKDYLDVTQEVDYKCDAWTVNSTVFSLPTNIKFTDISEVMQDAIKAKPSTTGSPSSQCSICSSLSGEAKDTCLSSLNCQ